MNARVKTGFEMLKETFQEWKDDDALQLGAALAYYTIFSLAPMLLVVIAVAGLVWQREAVQGEIVHQIQGLVGQQGAEAIQTMIANAGRQGEKSGILATIIAVATILFGATGVFTQLQSSLNHIWDVEPKPGAGVRGLLKTRLLSFGMILAIGFLLLVSLVVSTALAAVGTYMTSLLPAGAEILMKALTFAVSFAVITVLFAMMYRFLPDVKIAWRDVWVGATVTALLFTIGKFLIGLYLGNSSVASTFGAAGSVIVLLLWIYYSTQILFFGAEFTQVYATRYGSRIEPDKDAVRVQEVKVPVGEGEGGGREARRRDPSPRPAGGGGRTPAHGRGRA
ncbi:MAG TPA: YihY/virulence factor BrkB family protein [Thermoanaerobaculia bacterium]|nr:YihY/virulence factor BrkB family protein [Thermoanaerobaculia bacterium]